MSKWFSILKGFEYKFVKEIIHCESFIEDNICYNGSPISEQEDHFNISNLIFSHEFAKAFWGERESYIDHNTSDIIITKEGWQFHLQQMVLTENPLKYLEKFLNV